ncbi:uncharacterized protein BT62DRAFT_370605 [Guyanagaster necrorhizus]|uniref:Uncharacterized protein n=1 Tax=Guyanagaster necrorhizus TaxID=856835 RepID=A0A9P7VLK0_9AGAR|nr:uncharacterized protein BT62DRAFT_370605 [Guyanagaster necrorhizus MCA 3950]KAG7442707.1 hypothetical protein BT62DRAFT_370605 [Guyanagaster necrorhizus MCA 3950]
MTLPPLGWTTQVKFWENGKEFLEGHMVLLRGGYFRCLKAHTSGASNAPHPAQDTEYWKRFRPNLN